MPTGVYERLEKLSGNTRKFANGAEKLCSCTEAAVTARDTGARCETMPVHVHNCEYIAFRNKIADEVAKDYADPRVHPLAYFRAVDSLVKGRV